MFLQSSKVLEGNDFDASSSVHSLYLEEIYKRTSSKRVTKSVGYVFEEEECIDMTVRLRVVSRDMDGVSVVDMNCQWSQLVRKK